MSYRFSIIFSLNNSFRFTDTTEGDFFMKSLISSDVAVPFLNKKKISFFWLGFVRYLQILASSNDMPAGYRRVTLGVLSNSMLFSSSNFFTQ